MQIVFWTLIFLIVYCYFGYPLLLLLIGKLYSNPVKKSDFFPTVTVVISVWNEEDVIESKIQNLLSLDYPKEKLEIFIGSDGSTDQTNTIVEKFKSENVFLIASAERRGKMVMNNKLVAKSKAEIIVFSDARQIFKTNAIKELVFNFADSHIGCVSGELVFSEKGGGTAKGVGLYWRYEKFLRNQESKVHSMLGATGAIYAIRRELYIPIPEECVLDDVFVPLKIIQKGYRAIFDSDVIAFDKAADNPREEYSRKVRTLFGNYQIFSMCLSLFNPLKSPIAIQLFSHKFLRVLVPFFMIGIFFINILLINQNLYKHILSLQLAFYGLAFLGMCTRDNKEGFLRGVSKVSCVPYIFCLLNFSALMGFVRFIQSNQAVVWEKARKQ